jgi:hypothetical protein
MHSVNRLRNVSIVSPPKAFSALHINTVDTVDLAKLHVKGSWSSSANPPTHILLLFANYVTKAAVRMFGVT